MTTPADFLGSAWCADADGSGGFSNWVRTTDPSTCVNATTGTGTWYLMPLADAKALVSFAAASGSSSVSTAPAWSLSADDGAVVGWLIAAAWIGGWAGGLIVKAMNRATDPDD